MFGVGDGARPWRYLALRQAGGGPSPVHYVPTRTSAHITIVVVVVAKFAALVFVSKLVGERCSGERCSVEFVVGVQGADSAAFVNGLTPGSVANASSTAILAMPAPSNNESDAPCRSAQFTNASGSGSGQRIALAVCRGSC